MKFIGVLCGLLAIASVKAQSGNLLEYAYDLSMLMLADYDYEVNWYRDALTRETYDMGYYFTAEMAEAARVAVTDYQGEGLEQCALNAVESCEVNILWFDDQLRDLEYDARTLHMSVFKILAETNIKRYGAEEAYYKHELYINEMYAKLIDHDNRLWYAYIEMFFRFFDVLDELEYCIEAVLLPRK